MKVKLNFFRHRPLVDIFNNKKIYYHNTELHQSIHKRSAISVKFPAERERFLALKSVPSPSPALRHAKVGLLAEGGDIWFGWQHSGSALCGNEILGVIVSIKLWEAIWNVHRKLLENLFFLDWKKKIIRHWQHTVYDRHFFHADHTT